MIPISVVDIGTEEEDLVLEVLRSGRLAQGPMVERFEHEFAAAHEAVHAVAVSSGTTALVAAIQALDLQPGEEIITSPFSFVATLNAILEAGAVARFADIGSDMCIDPSSAEALIGPRTRAIMPVHLYGLPADMARLVPIAASHDLAIIEDAAQAHGAKVADRPVGSAGLACFSFYATKNIMCGEGGIITGSDDGLDDRLRLLRNQGMRARYQYELAGHNYRMTELQAAIAVAQLRRLPEITARRRANAARLTSGLSDLPIVLPNEPEDRQHVFHQYTVRVGADARQGRDAVAADLAEFGVGTGVYYPRLMHDYACYAGHPLVRPDHTPQAAQAAQEVLSLPVHQRLTQPELDQVVEAVRKAVA